MLSLFPICLQMVAGPQGVGPHQKEAGPGKVQPGHLATGLRKVPPGPHYYGLTGRNLWQQSAGPGRGTSGPQPVLT